DRADRAARGGLSPSGHSLRRPLPRPRELPARHRRGERGRPDRRRPRRRPLARGHRAPGSGAGSGGARGAPPGEHSPRAARCRGRLGGPQPLRGDHRLSRLRGPGASLRGAARGRARAGDRRARRRPPAGARRAHGGRVAGRGRDPAPRWRAGHGRGAVKRGSGAWLLAPALLLLGAFALPVGTMVPMSFRPYVPLVGITDGVTVRYYTRLVTDSYYLEIIGRTLALGFTVTLATLVIGYPVAFFLARTRSR